jgi:hypothetical protein
MSPQAAVPHEGLTNAEARRLLRVSSWQVNHLARHGRIRGRKVAEYWVLDRASVLAYNERRRRAELRLPAEPLLRQVQLRGGRAACGIVPGSSTARALDQAQASGQLSAEAADDLAVHVLGLTVWDLWPGAEALR